MAIGKPPALLIGNREENVPHGPQNAAKSTAAGITLV